jgi:hypothetical protein
MSELFLGLVWRMEENTGQTPCAKLGSMMTMMTTIDEESDNDDRFSDGSVRFNGSVCVYGKEVLDQEKENPSR